jgi:hypothetical protein
MDNIYAFQNKQSRNKDTLNLKSYFYTLVLFKVTDLFFIKNRLQSAHLQN